MFHAKRPVITFFKEILENTLEIDFTGRRFIPAGIISKMKCTDIRPGGFDIWNQVTFSDLLVIKVINYLDIRTVNCAANQVGLRNPCQKSPG